MGAQTPTAIIAKGAVAETFFRLSEKFVGCRENIFATVTNFCGVLSFRLNYRLFARNTVVALASTVFFLQIKRF